MAANDALAALVTQAPPDEDEADQGKAEVPKGRAQPRSAKGTCAPGTSTASAPASSSSIGRWFPFRFFRGGSSGKEKTPKQNMASVMPSQPCQAPKKWEPLRSADVITQAPRAASENRETPQCKPTQDGSSSSRDREKQCQAFPGSSASSGSSGSTAHPAPVDIITQAGPSASEESKHKKDAGQIPATDKTKKSPKSSPRTSESKGEAVLEAQLGPQAGPNIGRKTLVLDLDETLVHSSFRHVATADIVIEVEIEGNLHKVYVRKRPGVDEFLLKTAELYEIVIYTASMSKYANPLVDELDIHGVCHWRLFREACTRMSSGYAKDLSRLGRDLKDVIIIDNSPVCYSLQPDNAIPIQTWRDDPSDRELLDLIPILQSLKDVDNIPQVLRQIIWTPDDEDDENMSDSANGSRCQTESASSRSTST